MSHLTNLSFEDAKAECASLEAEENAAGEVLAAFPKGPLGLHSDEVRATPEYHSARMRWQKAFKNLQAFNSIYVRQFAKELWAERVERAKVREQNKG